MHVKNILSYSLDGRNNYLIWGKRGILFETLLQHAIYEPHTFILARSLFYIFVSHKVFDAGYVFNNCRNTFWFQQNGSFSAKIVSIWFLYSSRDPGNIQHSLSLSCFRVRRTDGQTENILGFLDESEIEYGQFLLHYL